MTALVLGAGGQLGTDLLAVLGDSATGLTHAQLDIGDEAAVRAAIVEVGPAVVYNAAAWTDVDGAEAQEEAAARINAVAPGYIAQACADAGALLVHASTDYVFGGDAQSPYDVHAQTEPKSAYGRTKLAGELAVRAALDRHYIVRTAWVYGCVGRNFVKTICRLAGKGELLRVVDDQFGSPTWSADLARGLVALAQSDAPFGIYHCTSTDETSWHRFAQAIFEEIGEDPQRVQPCATEEFERPAPRPAYSVLSDRAWREAGLPEMPHWHDALHNAFKTCGDELRAG